MINVTFTPIHNRTHNRARTRTHNRARTRAHNRTRTRVLTRTQLLKIINQNKNQRNFNCLIMRN